MRLPCVAPIFLIVPAGGIAFAETPLAATPPMGWNS